MDEITIVNTETGEVIVRPLTKEEIKQREIDLAAYEAKKVKESELQSKKLAAVSKLEALGLDIEDLKALGLG